MCSSGKPRLGELVKKAASMISYVLASAVVAMAMAYWPASAGNILTRLNLVPGRIAAAPTPDRTHKSDRLAVSFAQRWSAVPARAAEIRDRKNIRELTRAETRIEKIPFSCELAFSRIISKGNFSTRCIATIGFNARLADFSNRPGAHAKLTV